MSSDEVRWVYSPKDYEDLVFLLGEDARKEEKRREAVERRQERKRKKAQRLARRRNR